MIETAIELANAAEHEIRVAAIICDKRNRILATGINNPVKSHPIQARFAQQVNKKHCIYLHAEISALVKTEGLGDIIYVARVYRDGTPAMARPCNICLRAIKQMSNISKIVYTNKDGKITEEEI